METAFSLKVSEINPVFLKALNLLFGSENTVEITVRSANSNSLNVPETKQEYFARLARADENVKKGNIIRFTPKEFKQLTKKLSRR